MEVVNLKSHVFTFPDQILREVVFEYWFYIALGVGYRRYNIQLNVFGCGWLCLGKEGLVDGLAAG